MNFIINKKIPEEIKAVLMRLGNVYEAAKLNIEDYSVSFHPDMQIHFTDCKTAFCEPTLYEYYKKILPDYIALNQGKNRLGFTYPDNCAYNIARVGKNVIYNKNTADLHILNYYKNNGYNIINVNQGYTKCNVCKLSDSLIVTEDMGIYRSVKKNGQLNVIYMPVGNVLLENFKYGFIGGASGFADNTLLLCGKAPKELSDILLMNNINYIELSQNTICDYGSIISFG